MNAVPQTGLDRKFGVLYDKFYRADVLWIAWRRVRANKGAPGIDEQDFEYIEEQVGIERFLQEMGMNSGGRNTVPRGEKCICDQRQECRLKVYGDRHFTANYCEKGADTSAHYGF